MDATSSMAAEAFSRFLGERRRAGSQGVLFSPPLEDPLDAMKDRIRTLQEEELKASSLASMGLRLILLASASSPEAPASLDLLPSISQALRDASGEHCPFHLVVLLPSGLVSRREKVQIFRTFLHLEGLLGSFTGLESIWVHEIEADKQDSRWGLTGRNLRCFEMLYRALLDSSLQEVSAGVGSHFVNSQFQLGGRSACYSTGAARRFIYDAKRCHRYLSVRFQIALFKKGLLNSPALRSDKQHLSTIQERADAFAVRSCAELQPPSLPPPWGTPQSLRAQVIRDSFSQTVSMLESAAGAMIQGVADGFKDSGSMLEGKNKTELDARITALVKKEFLEALDLLPGRLAGGQAYLDILLGVDLLSRLTQADPKPTGFYRFQRLFCQEPVLTDLDEFCHKCLIELSHGLRQLSGDSLAEPSLDDTIPGRVLHVIHLADGLQPGPEDIPVRFLKTVVTSIFEFSRNPVLGPSLAESLLKSLLGDLAGEAAHLEALLRETEQSIEQQQHRLADHSNSTPWIKRAVLERNSYRTERDSIAAEIERLQGLVVAIRSTFDRILDWCIDLLGEVVWPHCIRAGINQLYHKRLESERRAFGAFLSEIDTAIRGEWSDAWLQSQSDSIQVDVLLRRRQKKLFQTLTKGLTPEEAVEALLQHCSQRGWDGRSETRSYLECRTLRDHYAQGAATLLDRMEDQARALFLSVLDMTVIDVLEAGGNDEAVRFLSDHLKLIHPDRFFSSIFMPQTLAKGLPHRTLVLQTGEHARSQLQALERSDYVHALESLSSTEAHFLINNDSTSLDLTWFAFGFPAYLMHCMEESRRIFHDEEGGDVRDLWPIS
jgi:hypothetical protein